jgi:hypothetical protein
MEHLNKFSEYRQFERSSGESGKKLPGSQETLMRPNFYVIAKIFVFFPDTRHLTPET